MPSLQIEDCILEYQILGAGTPIVLTPGGRAAKEPLLPLAEKLSDQHTVLLWDRRNCGASEVFINPQTSEQETWADDLTKLLKHLGMAPAYVAGGSAGARVSVLTALRHPKTVKGLVLWSCSGGPYGSQVLGYQYHVPFVVAAQAGGMAAVCETPFFAERIVANPHNRTRLMAMDPDEFIKTMQHWNTFFYYRSDTPIIGATWEELRSITIPTLIFEGNDDIHPKEASEALRSSVPGAILLPSPWTRDEWMDLYTGKASSQSKEAVGLMETLYPRLADEILKWTN